MRTLDLAASTRSIGFVFFLVLSLGACAAGPPAAEPMGETPRAKATAESTTSPSGIASNEPASTVGSSTALAPSAPKATLPALTPPFGVAASGTLGTPLTIHNLRDGRAVVRVNVAGAHPRFLLWNGSKLERRSELESGLPKLGSNDLVVVASVGSTFWLARTAATKVGEETCEVFRAKGGAWVSVGKTTADEGPCEILAGWTEESAVAVTAGSNGPALKVFGSTAKAPVLASSPKNKCSISPQAVRGWPTGELFVVGTDCRAETFLQGFAKGSTRPIVWATPVDGNAPYDAFFTSATKITLFGGGILPSDRNTEVPVRAEVEFDAKRFTQRSLTAAGSPGAALFAPAAVAARVSSEGHFSFQGGEVLDEAGALLLVGAVSADVSQAVIVSDKSTSPAISWE